MLVVDLGLDKDENFRMQAIPSDAKDLDQAQGYEIHQTPAGQRALLGCYYLCYKLSIFRRQLSMRHTNFIDQCGKELALRAEYPTDSNLVAYLDVQSLVRKAQLMLDDGLDDHLNHSRQSTWQAVLQLMEKQKIKERLVSCQASNDNWTLRLELSAMPILVLGHALRRQRDVFHIHEMGQLQAISFSAHRIVAGFLDIPPTVAVHLPTSSYTILWYGLLVLSKLSLLFPNDAAVPLGVDNQKIRSVGVAIMQRIGPFFHGGDVWGNSKKVIGSMLLWLEKSKSETRQTAFGQTSPIGLTRNAPENTENRLSSNEIGLTPLLGVNEDVNIHQDTWPMIEFPGHLDPAVYIEAHVPR